MMREVMLEKVARPRLKLTYQRAGLHVLLDELSTTPLIVVSGLPGSGKTTLVASYVESRNIPCLWYQVDRSDEDLATFFYYLGIAALKTNPPKKPALPRMPHARGYSISSLAMGYFRKLYQCLKPPFLIVLDNYQELPSDALLHKVIRDACAELPKGGRIVLISNSGYQTNMDSPHTNCPMAIIGCNELQLSPSEVKEIAALHGVTLSSEDAAKQLQAKVGGWASELIHTLQKGVQIPLGN